MAGQLSDKYMDTLEKWIGTGSKTFTLLYSITKDGCNATTFHQKCNNQGATVTVLYNQSKSIYGGYTSQSWTSRDGTRTRQLAVSSPWRKSPPWDNKYTPYLIRLRNGTPLNFRLCDSRGLEDAQGMDLNECSFLLDGHVPDFYQFNPAAPINAKTGSFVASPKLDNQAHGVIFVLDATTLDVMSDKVLQKMKEFQTIMNQKGLVQTLLLIKVDKLCDMVDAAVDKAANLLGIPRFNIWPVKNYEKEMDLDENTSILALLALRQILRVTESYLENLFYTLKCDGAIGSGNEDE